MKKIYAKYRAELWKAYRRPDGVDGDIALCDVRFLYRCSLAGF